MTTRLELDAVSDMALERPAEIDVPDIDELADMGSEQRIAINQYISKQTLFLTRRGEYDSRWA
jgi:hypothetical protein